LGIQGVTVASGWAPSGRLVERAGGRSERFEVPGDLPVGDRGGGGVDLGALHLEVVADEAIA
jgi:hypothetical protein